MVVQAYIFIPSIDFFKEAICQIQTKWVPLRVEHGRLT